MIRVKVDMARLRRDVRAQVAGIRAWEETLEGVGQGQVLVGRRKKLPFEKKAPLHGMHIANIFASGTFGRIGGRGRDPFVYTRKAEAEAFDLLDGEVLDACLDAYRTHRPQTHRLRRVLRAVAGHLAESAAENVEKGGLGKKRPLRVAKRIKQKGVSSADWVGAKPTLLERRRKAKARWLVKTGRWTGQYGLPPPFGIATGRWVKGFHGGWALGRRASRR